MAGPVGPILWIGLVVMTSAAILWESLLVTACVPPVAGLPSILSNFHLMELVSGNRSVRFGYIAFCTLGVDKGKPAQICSAINGITKVSPEQIAAALPNVNPALFNIAFFLNRTVFPIIPAVCLAFLALASLLMVGHYVVRQKNVRTAQMIMMGVLGCLGIALMLSLVSAVALTLTTSAIANMTALSRVGYIATRGVLAFRFHWLAFATNLVVIGLAGMILPKAGGKGMGGGEDYYYYDD